MMEDFELPKGFEKFRDVLKGTLKESLVVKAEEASTGPFDSKFGGSPYFPKSETYPVGVEGIPMRLLAQINFEQAPCLKNYPETGILQIYISTWGGTYGCPLDNKLEQKYFRVIYFEKVERDESKLMSDFSLVESERPETPIDAECRLIFTKITQPMSSKDFRFKKLFGPTSGRDVSRSDILEYSDMHNHHGHRIGGYPDFTQQDRRSNYCEGVTELLLQIDSEVDEGRAFDWADGGVGNFFISEEDLKDKDFSRIFYTYDSC